MNRPDEDPEILPRPLDRATAAVRDEAVDPQTVLAAAERAWRRVAEAAATRAAAPASDGAAIAGCAGFQALIPEFLAGRLPAARALLVQDHVRSCVPCRRALTEARTGALPAVRREASGPARRNWQRRLLPLAAALALATGLGGAVAAWLGGTPAGPAAVVETADGGLFRLDGTALASGAEVAPGEAVRTARGASALLRLADGSRLELTERTELALQPRRRGTTVALARGNVIVEAAPQGARRLRVATGECVATVHGTIFAVNHGIQGSRVSVVEGEVRVAQGGGAESVLGPGDQAVSRAGLGKVPVADEVAWSRHSERYAALLHELSALDRALRERVTRPGLRTAGELTGAVPAGAVLYAAVPNLAQSLAEGYAVFREQLATSPVLAAWWAEHLSTADAARIDGMIASLRDFGGYLGDELAVTLVPGPAGSEPEGPVVLARVARAGFADHLAAEAARINAEAGHTVIAVVADPADPGVPAGALRAWTDGTTFLASPAADPLAAVVATLAGQAPNFAGTPLGERVAAAYAGGVEWLLAVDADAVRPNMEGAPEAGHLAALGADGLSIVLVEHHGEGDRGLTTAELGFSGPRHGMAGWLAEPGPLGALDFISSSASLAVAVTVDDPAAAFAELTRLGRPEGAEGEDGDFGLELAREVAGALGGEAVFALDGPLVPEPAWKVVVEVYDPAGLQATIEQAVARVSAELVERGEAPLALEPREIAGRPGWRIAGGEGHEVFYLIADGYLVAAPDAALLETSLALRAAGSTLPASAAFRALLPADRHTGLSALAFQHLAPVLAPLAGELARIAGAGGDGSPGSPADAAALAALSEDRGPMLVGVYAEADRIVAVGNGPGGPLGPGMLGLPGFSGLALLRGVGEAVHPEAGPR